MTLMMKRIVDITRKKPANEEVQHKNLLEEVGEQSNVQVVKYPQPKINEVATPDQLKELIKEDIKDQVDYIIQPSHTYAKPYSYTIDHLKMPTKEPEKITSLNAENEEEGENDDTATIATTKGKDPVPPSSAAPVSA
ncbi:hypothetical protein PVK06_040126 [Gossypium arboreum]|uniref:Uncharacterized protein n=1 Tax=Gossypium arboreum TaxID=29729 RepID=A0ABR0N5D8_GOSAR|nr:hypothetical protein PVK06_040126 [Gossypium arboreum]